MRLDAVSYTHLDVYKRQNLYCNVVRLGIDFVLSKSCFPYDILRILVSKKLDSGEKTNSSSNKIVWLRGRSAYNPIDFVCSTCFVNIMIKFS